jgi:hypothetical protein
MVDLYMLYHMAFIGVWIGWLEQVRVYVWFDLTSITV